MSPIVFLVWRAVLTAMTYAANRHVLFPSDATATAPANRERIGTVSDFINLDTGDDFPNEVDAGIASIDENRRGSISLDSPYGPPDPAVEPFIGMRVSKLGAQTGLTHSEVLDAHFLVRLPFPGLGLVGFRNQIKSRKFTEHGDSGSMVWDASGRSAIGLHFAGTSKDSLANPIGSVLNKLGAKLRSTS